MGVRRIIAISGFGAIVLISALGFRRAALGDPAGYMETGDGQVVDLTGDPLHCG